MIVVVGGICVKRMVAWVKPFGASGIEGGEQC